MLTCSRCSNQYDNNTPLWRCTCGSPLDYRVEKSLKFEGFLHTGASFGRFTETLGLDCPDQRISLGEGATPLVALPWQGVTVHFKLDFMQPTGSYKDRGVACMVSRFREQGITEVVEDSSGNAGSSLAAYCARAGMTCHVFVPEATSASKKMQISAAGAVLHSVGSTREETTVAALKFAEGGRTYGGHNWNPWFSLGVRTWALEVWDQMNRQAPDALVLPVGQGSLALGAWRAFSELQDAGLIDKMPRIYAVQTLACNPLARAFQQNSDEALPIEKSPTLAEGIASAQPVRGTSVLRAVRDSKGDFVSVSEEDIARSFYRLARLGLYVEPTSAVVGSGLDLLLKGHRIAPHEKIVAFLSGSGLKATDYLLSMSKQFPASSLL